MASFRDSLGREWPIRIDVGALLDVRDRTGMDLPSLMRSDDAIAEFLFGDATGIAKALWVLCEDRAKEIGLDERKFYRVFDGPTLEAATEALLQSVANFSPRSKIGAALAKTTTEMMNALDRRAISELNRKKAEVLGSDLLLSSPESAG